MIDVISQSAVSFYQMKYIRRMMKFGRACVTEKPFAGHSRAFRPSIQRLRSGPLQTLSLSLSFSLSLSIFFSLLS
jgi:hypothetical protein